MPKQGMMSREVNTPDNDPREAFDPQLKQNEKKVLSPGTDTPVADLASGMLYDAKVYGHSNGYTTMTFYDYIYTKDAFIGATDKDVREAVTVTGPDGQVPAEVNIERSGNEIHVMATVTNITKQGDYTMTVPTYVTPTKQDYTLEDHPTICYTTAKNVCYDSENKVVRKVTPPTDKVWVLDEQGALTTADPNHTNTVGVDGKTLAPGSPISAVVNATIPANLDQAAASLVLKDDWSDAKDYLTFPLEGTKVFANGKDVSESFVIKTDYDDGYSTATAKKYFLETLKKASGPTMSSLVGTRTELLTLGQDFAYFSFGDNRMAHI